MHPSRKTDATRAASEGWTRRAPFTAGLLALALVGCVVGPDYVEPELDMPDAWHTELVDGLQEDKGNLHTWWTSLGDPTLTSLIERARTGNLDLMQALWRVEEARAARGIAMADRYPTIDAIGNISRRRVSEGVLPDTAGVPRTDTFSTLGLGASWELDVFGGITRNIEAADASLQAEVESLRDVMVLLFSEVALNYVQLRATQDRIEAAESNVKTQRDTLKLTQDRFDAQISPQLDVRQAELNLAQTEATVPGLRALEATTIQTLGVLLGEHPEALFEELSPVEPIPTVPADIPVMIPADLLRQRPDVRAAERVLAAEVADIGVATADLYPRFSLNGSFTYQARKSSSGGTFDSGNRAWSLSLPMRWNIFDGWNIRNQINVQAAQAEQAMIQYENTVLFALQDVEASMTLYINEIQTREALQRAVVAAQQSVTLVDTLYRTGLTDFQNVLDTQRSLFQLEDQLASSEGAVVQNLVQIYRAFGGGWNPDVTDEQVEQAAATAKTTVSDNDNRSRAPTP